MESLTIQLRPFFDWLLWVSLQGSVLIGLIILIQLILRGRLGIRWHYLLWVLLLIRLAVPWLPESKMSIFNLLPKSIQQGRIIEAISEPQRARGMGRYLFAESEYPQKVKSEGDSESVFTKFVRISPLIWLLGTVVLAVYVCAGNLHLWWLVNRERPLTDQKILDLLEDCKSEMGIRTILGIVTTDKVKSPALFGFVRPRLLLPVGMPETLSREELRYVFLHELAHLKRHDIYLGYLSSILQVLHWFNPLIWLAFYRIRNDRELACDYLVLARLTSGGLSRTKSGQSKDYGRTIVYLLERFSRPRHLPAMAGILETKSQLKRRIKMIAKFKKTSRPQWAGAMLLVVVLACVVLTNAYVAKADFTFGTVTNLGPTINGPDEVLGVCISYDGLELYFCSDRPGGYGGYDLWMATRPTIDDDWSTTVNLGPNVNSQYDCMAPSISADGLTLYFSDYDYGKILPGGVGSTDIWMVTRETKDAAWSAPVNVGKPVNHYGGNNSPNISADGLELYFASGPSRGGSGLYDLWLATRATTEDDWGAPNNLGPSLNSPVQDSCPSISADGLSLFFMSDRTGGQGDFDIWMTSRVTKEHNWSPPVNLGPVVNSSANDLFPHISANGSTLYFCSAMPGGFGGLYGDIWQVPILPVVDFNADGIVDSADVCMMVDHWLTDEPLYDIAPLPYGDGIVDVKDLVLLAEHLTIKEEDPNETNLP